MSACVKKHVQIRYCLNRVLEINPGNQKASQALNRLSSQTSLDRPSRKKRKPSKASPPKKLLSYLAGGFIFVCCGCLGLIELLGSDNLPAVSENSPEEVGALPQQIELGETPTSSTIPTLLNPTATLLPAAAPTETLIPIPGSYSCVPQNTQRDQAELSRVIDGDTIEVKIAGQAYTVRYIGMDTPENGMPFFTESSEHNRQLLAGKTLVLVKDVSEIDQYDRLLRYVFAGETFVNWQMVQDGYAQVATYPPDVACTGYYLEAETTARNLGIGLWEVVLVPTATTAPTSTTSVAVCSCSSDTYNCSNFTTHAQAQACHDYCVTQGAGDIHGLDRDNDGDACESLP